MTHHLPIRVYYEDTDMAGIVYHANYLKYIERARSDWVRGLGLDQNAMQAAGQVFVVRRIEADYLAPARLDDELQVQTDITKVSGVRLLLDQQVLRGEQLLFRAAVTVVLLNQSGSVARLPAIIRQISG
ncbi:MAG: tol-pal system-associated acyl-CoA thioesterase [Rhodobacterales bacterium]|nr:MAG: tol-pal system-associated acyl-CoA thioesterase [Rhodobacterales bacterium]